MEVVQKSLPVTGYFVRKYIHTRSEVVRQIFVQTLQNCRGTGTTLVYARVYKKSCPTEYDIEKATRVDMSQEGWSSAQVVWKCLRKKDTLSVCRSRRRYIYTIHCIVFSFLFFQPTLFELFWYFFTFLQRVFRLCSILSTSITWMMTTSGSLENDLMCDKQINQISQSNRAIKWNLDNSPKRYMACVTNVLLHGLHTRISGYLML